MSADMGGLARVTKSSRNMSLIAGIKKRWSAKPSITLAGRQYTPAALVALFEKHQALLDSALQQYAQWIGTVAKERALDEQLRPLVRAMYTVLVHEHGLDAAVLADFGMEPHRKTGPKTTAAKLASAKKSRATREARNTKPGPRGRRKRRA